MAMDDAVSSPALERAFQEERSFLWGLLYRLTGDAADAEDLVQETFVRFLRRPPRTDRALRPWLVKVALNLGRDLLRRRKRRGYPGPWLPSPVETPEDEPAGFDPPDPEGGPAARYERIESVSLAFLLALEALTPQQRAVLLLRDVFDYSVREAARALGISEANARTTHLRARRLMAAYDAARRPPTRSLRERTRAALDRFLACVLAGDVPGAEALLAEDARAVSDAAGEFHANHVPVLGRAKVAALFIGVARGIVGVTRSEVRLLNGLPSLIAEHAARPGFASKWVVQCEVDDAGRLRRLYTVLASRKLAAVP
jgi:RNA polymerase sigma factor (sigma-70 family)